jgi:endonuclease III
MAGRKKNNIDRVAAKKRVGKIFPILKKAYPDAHTSLDHRSPFQLLIATILSAQCTDVRVNIVTKNLFRKYKSPSDWIAADIEQIEADIRSTGFYRNKAANIKKTCQILIEKFNGKVPDTMEHLCALAGVGRKTANVMLGNCFDTPGIVCDTHVIRLSRRLELSEHKDPVKLEYDLMEIVPKRALGGWTMFSHLLVFHGRAVCKARKPNCDNCPVTKHCPAANKQELW